MDKTRSRLRRAHSLSGVVPLGAFLTLHVLTNASSLGGERPFLVSIRGLQGPGVMALELAFIVLPLAFHGVYGVVLARDGTLRSPYPQPWVRSLLHGTGLVTFAFVALHLWQLSIQKWTHGMSPLAFHTELEARLSSTLWGVPWIAIAYMVGVACTCLHFAVGLWGFTVTWELSRSPRAKRRVAWTAGTVGTLLFVLGAVTVIRFATGSNIVTPIEPMPYGAARPACSGQLP